MRCLDRDRRTVYISRTGALAPVLDANGRLTGKHAPTLTEPEAFRPTVSAARGEAVNEIFGQNLDYDRTLTFDNPRFDVKESDLLWIDNTTDGKHDYIVKRVARSGSFIVIAAKHVEVSA